MSVMRVHARSKTHRAEGGEREKQRERGRAAETRVCGQHSGRERSGVLM
jgi:hypothetical protein